MLKLLRENIRTALGSIRSQLLRTVLTIVIIGIGIWALVGILASVAALQATMNANFADMGSNTFSITQYDWSERLEDESEREENPAISYPQAKAFKDRFDFPQSTVSLAFEATAKAEVRYESKKT
ncbi:MAG TPA: ABC transporter permease, partial [Flavobacterium sp.]|nr:ABC transporter permease [Flavobacterium sp.]